MASAMPRYILPHASVAKGRQDALVRVRPVLEPVVVRKFLPRLSPCSVYTYAPRSRLYLTCAFLQFFDVRREREMSGVPVITLRRLRFLRPFPGGGGGEPNV